MCENKISQIFQKLKNWYRGEHIPYTLQEMMDLSQDRRDEPRTEHLPDRFHPPLFARIINIIYRFWLRRWTVLLPIIVALLMIAVLLFIHFDSKSISHTTKETKTYSKYQTFNEILRDHK